MPAFFMGRRQKRGAFRRLISVNGVGPQVGLALPGLWTERIDSAITAGDLRDFARLRGR